MHTKLTLRLDDQLIKQAKRYAARRGTSVSQMVAAYFQSLIDDADPPPPDDDWTQALSPMTRSLIGRLAGSDVDEDDYRRFLEDKYQ